MKTVFITVFTSVSLLLLFSKEVKMADYKPKMASCSSWSYNSSIVTTVNYTNPAGVAIYFNDANEDETVEIYGPGGYSAWDSVPTGGFKHFAVPSSGTYYVYVNYNNSCQVGTGVVTVP